VENLLLSSWCFQGRGRDEYTVEKRNDFFPNVYPWVLADSLVKKDLLKIIARRCSVALIWNCATGKKNLSWTTGSLHLRSKMRMKNYALNLCRLPNLSLEVTKNGDA